MEKTIRLAIVLLTIFGGTHVTGMNACAAEKKGVKPAKSKLLTRIDFGNSYINGQTLKSGSVYLLQRKKNEVTSMLTLRENYRKEILEAHKHCSTDNNGKPRRKGLASND